MGLIRDVARLGGIDYFFFHFFSCFSPIFNFSKALFGPAPRRFPAPKTGQNTLRTPTEYPALRGGRRTQKIYKKSGPDQMAETPRAGTGDSACRS